MDGQQRITTLSPLLIHLRGCLAESEPEDSNALNHLILSSSFGETTFNLHVLERENCRSAILDGRDFDPEGEPESVRNLWSRYQTVTGRVPEDLQGDTV